MNRLNVYFWRLRSWAARAIVPRRAVVSRGLRFTLQCDNWVTYYRWQSYNTKEPETLDWVDQRVRPGDTVFDVGANIGLYTIYTALRHKPVRVIAFEPEYANLHMLRDNIVLNGLQEAVDVYSLALSRDSGPSHLYIQDFTPGAALHSVSSDRLNVTHTQRTVVGREGIWVTAMDSFCEKTGLFPNCIKIDVDGTELEILEGGKTTLRAPSVRSVIIEMPVEADLRGKCQRLLEEAGLTREWCSQQSPNEVWIRK
jgi:FkbM family methyltransferase